MSNIFTKEEIAIILNKEVSNIITDNDQPEINIVDDQAEKLRIKKEKLKASQKKYVDKNREKIYAYNREHFKAKYDNDKAFRESMLKQRCIAMKIKRDNNPLYKEKIYEQSKLYTKNKRDTDPEYRKLSNERSNAFYHKKKLLNESNNIIISTN
jgi:hypothetical protein